MTLRVDDEGPGISEEARARIFDAFYTTRTHGVGIGLALVKRIIDDHAAHVGAHIDVVSPDSGGASFRVTLAAAAELHPPRPATDGDSRRVRLDVPPR